MTREEFDKVMYRTLVAMGDHSYEAEHPSWDEDYGRMQFLSTETFQKVCDTGVFIYNKSNSTLNN